MKNLILLWVFMLCSGCAQFNPYLDSRREAGVIGTIGPSTDDKISICYNALASNAQQIIAMAEKECAKTGRKPIFTAQKSWDCSFLVPTRVEYLCVNSENNR